MCQDYISLFSLSSLYIYMCVCVCPCHHQVDQIPATSHNTHYELPFTVNHVALSFPAVQYGHKDYAP